MTLRIHRAILVAAVLAVAPGIARAQAEAPRTPEAVAALATVERLFDAMRAGDTAAMRATFAPGAVLMNVNEKGEVGTTDLGQFLVSVAGAGTRQPPLILDERLFNVDVRVNGPLATVWTEYDFYAGPRFSHCGVDAVQLARTADGWRIFQIADTRQRDGCPRPVDPA